MVTKREWRQREKTLATRPQAAARPSFTAIRDAVRVCVEYANMLDKLSKPERYAPLSKGEIAQAVVDIANNEGVRAAFSSLLKMARVPRTRSPDSVLQQKIAESDERLFRLLRQNVVGDLAAIATDYTKAATSERVLRLAEGARNTVIVPRMSVGAKPRMVDRVLTGNNISAAVAYAVLLFLDGEQPFGRTLCRCQAEQCGKFFWEKANAKGGPRRRSYCSDSCMKEAHSKAKKHYMRKYRAKRTN